VGFHLHAAICACDAAAAAEVEAAMRALIPAADVRRMSDPFDGVIAGHVYDSYEDWCVEDAMPALSARLGARPVGFVDVDCFGGVCMYGGAVRRDGAVAWTAGRASQDGHQRVLAAMGLPASDRYFAPFTRAFWDGESAPAERRRPITCALRGTVDGPFRPLALALARVDGWRVTIANDTTLVIVCGADDLALSLNDRGGTLELGGRAHVPVAEAIAALDALIADGPALLGRRHALELTDLDGALLHRWSGPR
jgi:hypothetical protein